jgi:hypothetical protein
MLLGSFRWVQGTADDREVRAKIQIMPAEKVTSPNIEGSYPRLVYFCQNMLSKYFWRRAKSVPLFRDHDRVRPSPLEF